MPRYAVVADNRFLDHLNPNRHPESNQRLAAIERGLAAADLAPLRVNFEPRLPTREQLEQVHAPTYIDWVERIGLQAHQSNSTLQLDIDTYCSQGTVAAAHYAAGAGLTAIDALAAHDDLSLALCLGRPPGHHATINGPPMGFCLWNNVAVAAAYAKQTLGFERIAIVDWDVHHGNGTQDIFYDDPTVLLISMQRYPQWPHTGSFFEEGIRDGLGCNVNIPLPISTGDRGYLRAWDRIAEPILLEYKPQLILISAGFDAHMWDPLGEMAMSSLGFYQLSARLSAVAKRLGVKVLTVLEGGYSLAALEEAVPLSVRGLLGLPHDPGLRLTIDENPVLVDEYLDAACEHLSRHWESVCGLF